MKQSRLLVVLVLLSSLAGCKIELYVSKDGTVVTVSQSYSCDSGQTCQIEVVDTNFEETFRAIPNPGYRFVAWMDKDLAFCRDSTEPCSLSTTFFPGTPLMPILESDRTFYLEPIFGKPDSWENRAVTPTAGSFFSTCEIKGKLYAIGMGYGSDESLDTAEVYDPAKNSWSALAKMPTPRVVATASEHNDKCYVFGGGLPGSHAVTDKVEIFDPKEGSWSTGTPMPEGRDAAASATVDGKIYIIGGGDAVAWMSTPYAPVRIYDPATDKWSTGANMPTPRKGLGAAAIGRYIYAVGGYDPIKNVPGNVLERYDPVEDKWIARAKIPQALNFPAVVAVDGKLYVMGGFMSEPPSSRTTEAVWQYDPADNSWRQRADMPIAVTGAGAEVLSHQIYAVGGRAGAYSDAMPINHVYTP